MVTIIKKLIITTCSIVSVSSFAAVMPLRTSVPLKEGFDCNRSCTKSTCSSDLNTAAACVAWCGAEEYQGCWQGAVDTIKFQETLIRDAINSPLKYHETFLKLYGKLSPAVKKDLLQLFQNALSIAKAHHKQSMVPEKLTQTIAKRRLDVGLMILKELQAIHHEQEKELRGVFGTQVP